MWLELVELAALLLALTMLLNLVYRAFGKANVKARLIQGILYGLISVFGMSMAVNFSPGVIFDPRSVIVSMAGFFGGPFAALPAILIAGSYRLSLGGVGAIAGTMVVVLSTAVGLLGYYLRQRKLIDTRPLHLFLLGFICHVAAMFGMLFLPSEIMWSVITGLSIPFFIMYPFVTVFLGFLIANTEYYFDLEGKLKHSTAQLRSLFDTAPNLIWFKDADGTYMMCNTKFESFAGFKESELSGKKDNDLFNSDMARSFRENDLKVIREDQALTNEEWVTFAVNGEKVLLETTKVPVRDGAGHLVGVLGVAHDVTERKRVQSKLDYLAYHDPLTDLPNRLYFNLRLEQALNHAERNQLKLAVLFIDLDNFKDINDSFGHKAGDDFLTYIAKELSTAIRSEDTIARISGDEFLVLFEELDSATAITHAIENILGAFSKAFQIQGHNIHTTASIGISTYPTDGDNAIDLLRNADAAMYRAKEERGNSYQFYTQELTQRVLDKIIMENELREALANNEFYLVYQPQINLDTRCVVGLEALIRWRHPYRDYVGPNQFIPVAENSGLIKAIGEWVLRQACQQAKIWLDQGVAFGRIAVNVSGAQVNKGELYELVKQLLQETGLPARYLELEVTESLIMEQTDSSIAQLSKLRDIGVMLSVDDFGTGYSSLSYLKRLPIHKLKIDQSFIRDILTDMDDKAIVDAIIAMGTSLGLKIIAEGVEVEEQESLLTLAACDEAQGYLYSKPITAKEIEAYLS